MALRAPEPRRYRGDTRRHDLESRRQHTVRFFQYRRGRASMRTLFSPNPRPRPERRPAPGFSLHPRFSASLLRPVLCVVMIFFGACPGRAAVDAYLKIEGVDGDSTDSQHPKWIQVLSFSQAVSAPSAAASLPSLSEICFLKLTDRASPVLEQDCAKGKSFPSATLELITVAAARARFYQIVLSNVVVSSMSASGGAGDVKPAES